MLHKSKENVTRRHHNMANREIKVDHWVKSLI